jgi:hypothetical protein
VKRFTTAYDPARARFLENCAVENVSVRSVEHPTERGPQGQALFTDIAWLGATDAPNLVIIGSGTHGVEGLCGSGIQSALLETRQAERFSQDTALVLVHAMNPHGFANLRRAAEGNVDLNRNFIDHSAPPENPAYSEVHALLVPPEWSGPTRLHADLAIAKFRAERGERAWQAAVTGGQYVHPDGLFYGGAAPVWSNRMWRQFIAEHCGNRKQIVHIDLHTGLGPYGVGEKLVVVPVSSPAYQRAKQLLGDDICAPWAGDSASGPVVGFVGEAFRGLPASTQTTLMALEFGTASIENMLATLRAENWLHAHGDPHSDDARSLRHLMKAAFFVDEADWQQQVVERTFELLGRVAHEISHV